MSRNTKIILGVLVIIILATVLFISNNGSRTDGAPVKIGLLLPLSGPLASFGEAMKTGYEWKAAELNAEGKQIELVIADSKSTPKDAVAAFSKLVDIDKVSVVFTTLSAVSLSVKPIAEQKGVLLWADVAHPAMLTDSRFILRHSNTSDSDAEVIGQKIIDQGDKSVGVLFQNDDWGQIASKLIVEKLGAVKVVTTAESIDNKGTDFRQQLSKIISRKPDTLAFLTAGPSAGILIKQARELGFMGDIVSSIGIVLTPDAQAIAGDHLAGTFYQDYEVNQAYTDDYRARFSSDPAAFSRVAYSDLELLMNAIDKVGSTDSLTVVGYIKSLDSFSGKYEELEIKPSGDIFIKTVIKQWPIKQ